MRFFRIRVTVSKLTAHKAQIWAFSRSLSKHSGFPISLRFSATVLNRFGKFHYSRCWKHFKKIGFSVARQQRPRLFLTLSCLIVYYFGFLKHFLIFTFFGIEETFFFHNSLSNSKGFDGLIWRYNYTRDSFSIFLLLFCCLQKCELQNVSAFKVVLSNIEWGKSWRFCVFSRY